jgi:hypothetical protein
MGCDSHGARRAHICAACGLVEGIGFLNEKGKVVQEDGAPDEGFLEESGKFFCTHECLSGWLSTSQERRVQNPEEAAARLAGIVAAKTAVRITTLSVKPTRRRRKIIYLF